MVYKGLCSTCVRVKTCIFVKDHPPVWECEEFSIGNRCSARRVAQRAWRVASGEAAVEEE